MAALALTNTRSAFGSLRRGGFLAAFSWSTPAVTLTLPSLQSLIDLFPPILMAVPKKKVSHSRKSMRSANKGLKDKTSTFLTGLFDIFYVSTKPYSSTDIVNCPGCGGPKLAHHLCPACYSSMSREWKSAQKGPVDMVEDMLEPPVRPA
jgi:large subunit ribosomal protein L32